MHYILEIFIYRFHEGPIVYCGHRLGSKDYPGVWMIEGKVFVDRRDTLEEKHVYLHT